MNSLRALLLLPFVVTNVVVAQAPNAASPVGHWVASGNPDPTNYLLWFNFRPDGTFTFFGSTWRLGRWKTDTNNGAARLTFSEPANDPDHPPVLRGTGAIRFDNGDLLWAHEYTADDLKSTRILTHRFRRIAPPTNGPSPLVGSWRKQDNDLEVFMELYPDGTLEERALVTEPDPGVWSLQTHTFQPHDGESARFQRRGSHLLLYLLDNDKPVDCVPEHLPYTDIR